MRGKQKASEEVPKRGLYKILIVSGMVVLLGVSLFLIFRQKRIQTESLLRGYIISEGQQSDEVDGLFLMQKNRYLINFDKLDEIVSADVIATENGKAIRTSRTQIIVEDGSRSYTVNQNRIEDDDNYLAPVKYGDDLYGDTDTIFQVFGYGTKYETSADGTLVKLELERLTTADPYEKITPINKENNDVEGRPPQVEESAIYPEQSLNGPQESIPAVPRPATGEGEGQQAEETYPEEVQKIIDNRPTDEEKPSETISYVPRDSEAVNSMSDEEFEQKWNEEKGAIISIFDSGVPTIGNVTSKERTEDMIAYNPMKGGIYYDTVCVSHDVSDDIFVKAEFSSDWSDQASNTDSQETQAYYNAIPRIYEATIKKLIGEEEGSRLFAYIKEHADIMKTGGYIAVHGADGDVQSQWTDGNVGDGVMAGKLDFSDWQNRTTDDGLRYSVTRNGEGFTITVYKR